MYFNYIYYNVIAKPNDKPAETIDQEAVAGPDTKTGEDLFVIVLLPICPEVPKPHAYNLPKEVIASECDIPAEIVDQDVVVGPDTKTGDDFDVVLLSPN